MAKAALKLAPAALAQPAQKSLLRFITCGSVDDGKSTLLGRLLWETNSVFEDQAEALERDSKRFGTTGDVPDLALLVDGLAAEREQGITIDVAYRYFGTPQRAFIAADTPGHEQYTRNMATGASTADVAIILVDARKGLLPQTRRHSYIVSMIGVRDVIIAVNKMDLVDYSEEVFRQIEADYAKLVPTLGFANVHVIPLSARAGDNVTGPSEKTPWYTGPSLLHLLETMETRTDEDAKFRLPVQWVNRPHLDFRGFSGTIASGEIRLGDAITVLPRGTTSRISGILTPTGEADSAQGGQAVTLSFADEIDCSRGDVIVASASVGKGTRHVSVRLLALTPTPAQAGKAYLVKLATATTGARIEAFDHGVDVHDYSTQPTTELAMNGIGLARLYFETPLYASTYKDCRVTGSLLLIDPVTNEAVALGVIERVEAEIALAAVDEEIPVLRHLGRAFSGVGALPDGATQPDVIRYTVWRIWSGALVGLVAGLFAGSFLTGALVALADIILRPILRGSHDRLFARWQAYRAGRAQEKLSVDGGGI
jgi:sulfate adenylyltransferase large subunit